MGTNPYNGTSVLVMTGEEIHDKNRSRKKTIFWQSGLIDHM